MSVDLGQEALIQSLPSGFIKANNGIADLELAAKTIAASPEAVTHVLAACLLSESRLTKLASQAYQHPNGFAKFVLHDDPASALRLRLHVWTGDTTQQQQQTDRNIHGHKWEFASAVIAGNGLQIDEYVQVATGGKPYVSFEYQSDRAAGSGITGELQPIGHARLDHSVRHCLARGDAYSCDTSKLHTVAAPAAQLVATMIVQGPSVLATAPVFRRPGQPPQAPARPIGVAEARQVLSATLRAVSLSQ